MGTHPRLVGSTARARATGHHKGTTATLKPGQTLALRAVPPLSLTVLNRSVVLWVKEAMGR
jgi:hypothetical protein